MILAIDAGGTFLKSSVRKADGTVVPQPEISACSDGTAEEIGNAFRLVVQSAERNAGLHLTGIAVCIPGPFDFQTGEFRMDHKFRSVKGRNIREFLPELPLLLVHDANAFLMGIPGWDQGRVGGITLGTGLGAAVAISGVCQNNERQTPLYPLWNRPFRSGIAEDYVSARALLKAFPQAKTVKEMADAPGTEAIWEQFGTALAELLASWQAELSLDRIVIGGGISRAKEHFLVSELSRLPIEFSTTGDPALAGLFNEYNRRRKER